MQWFGYLYYKKGLWLSQLVDSHVGRNTLVNSYKGLKGWNMPLYLSTKIYKHFNLDKV